MTQRDPAQALVTVADLHGTWLATGETALLIVTIGAVAAITLVALVPREHRVEAIRATADLLSTLLPWPGRRDRNRTDR
jgi:hypothetical protein